MPFGNTSDTAVSNIGKVTAPMERKAVWEEHVFVNSSDVDPAGRLKISSLYNFFQNAAGNHVAHLGLGYADLRRLGFFWVLCRSKIQIYRLPVWGETLCVSTWPKGDDGLLYLRDFRIKSEQDVTIVDGSTGWLLLDTDQGRPHTAEVLPFPLLAQVNRHAIEKPLTRIKAADDLELMYERKVMVSDLDVNNHVNNARYLEWIADCYDLQHVTSKTVATVQVNYVGGSRLGDIVQLYKGTKGAPKGMDYVEGVVSTGGSKVVQALIEWK